MKELKIKLYGKTGNLELNLHYEDRPSPVASSYNATTAHPEIITVKNPVSGTWFSEISPGRDGIAFDWTLEITQYGD